MTVEEFEEKWNHTITSYHLEENEWLAKLYEERERWVFLNSNFFAGMSTTQRSESMNAFFDGYLHSSITLKAFVEQIKNVMWNKVEKEILSDFECFKSKLECSSSSPMEKQFQKTYTHEIFKRVRIEFFGKHGHIVKEVIRGGEDVKYNIQDEAATGRLFEVRFSSSKWLVGCVCCMFKFRGILCRHALFVLSQECVTVLPDRYILDRWRKDIKRKHTYVSTCTDDV